MREKVRRSTARAVFLLLAVFLSVLCFQWVTAAAKEESQVKKYVVMGDSIAAGYALEGYEDEGVLPRDSYAARIGKELGVTPVNCAKSGITSQEVLDKLKNGAYDEALSGADFVTLSFGSNDLLEPFTDCLYAVFGEEFQGKNAEEAMQLFKGKYNPATKDGRKKLQDKWLELRERLLHDQKINAAPEKFSDIFSETMDLLRKKAPKARIFVTSMYNPFRTFELSLPGIFEFDLGTVCDDYIERMNQKIYTQKEGYELVDVYPVFQKYPCVNARFTILDLSQFSLDPHPDVYGHKVIAEMILNTWKPERLLKQISVKKQISLKEGRKGKIQIMMPESQEGKWNPYEEAATAFYSSNDKVVKVSRKGKLTAGKAGTAKVKVSIFLNGVEKKYPVKVRVS